MIVILVGKLMIIMVIVEQVGIMLCTIGGIGMSSQFRLIFSDLVILNI